MSSSANKQLRDKGIERREMTLFLRYETHPTQHFCMYCRQGIFNSHFRAIAVIVGEGSDKPFVNAPISIQCHKCGTVYHIQGTNQ